MKEKKNSSGLKHSLKFDTTGIRLTKDQLAQIKGGEAYDLDRLVEAQTGVTTGG